MANMAYLALVDDWVGALSAGAVTAVTEDADYPIANIRTIPAGDTARVTGASPKIRIDFGVNRAPGAIAFLNHNISAGDWLVRSYDDAYSTPSGESAAVAFREFDAILQKSDWSSRRYWEADFNGCTFKDSGFLEIGKMAAAASLTTFCRNFAPELSRSIAYNNSTNQTPYGIRYTHIKNSNVNKFQFRWNSHLRDVILPELQLFMRKNYGGAYPVIVLPSSAEADVYYLNADDEASWSERWYGRRWISDFILAFVEQSRGKVQVEAP